jgi:hypothetical protein
MSQSNRDPKFRDNFFVGLAIVLLLHIVFVIIWFPICIGLAVVFPFFNTNYNSLFLLYPMLFLGLTQSAYLLPAYFLFARKGRGELCKGILAGAFLTLLVNGTCSTTFLVPFIARSAMPIIGLTTLGALVVGAIGAWLVGRGGDRS